jgi:hypothetical protein
MKKRTSTLLLILGVISAAMIAVAVWAAGTHLLVRDRPATLAEVSGTVLYSPAGNPQWVTARTGMPLRRGDQLLTLPSDGLAIVQLDDGNVAFSLVPDTLITLTAGWNSLRQAGEDGVYLNHGALMAITQKDLPAALTRFCIDTQVAEVTVESTWLMVQVLKTEPTTRVSSLEGRVRVRAKPAAAALYWPDAQRLPGREAVVDDSETLLVYIRSEPTPTSALGGNLGRVVDAESGRGRAGVVVNVVGNPELFAVTDANGYFSILDAPARSETVAVGAIDEVEGALELRPNVGQMTGRVVDAVSGEGVAQARIIPMGYPELATETGPDGAFALDELPVGTHSLTVVAPQHISVATEVTIDSEVLVEQPLIAIWPVDSMDTFLCLPIIFNNYWQYP